jgi:Na+/proline symporter
MLPGWLIVGASFAYLLLLFAVAYFGDRRADAGRSVIDNPWVFSLSLAVYCTAWTYFGSVGRAASGGPWFLPTYLGPTLGLTLAWLVVLKMIRIARSYRVTSIADFVASRYGKSHLLGGLVTLIAVVGIVPYIALQLKAISSGYALLVGEHDIAVPHREPGGLVAGRHALHRAALAAFTMLFGTRHLDATERHEGMVAAIAFESVVKLVAFLAVGIFVTSGSTTASATSSRAPPRCPSCAACSPSTAPGGSATAAGSARAASMLSIIFLPRQFQIAVVENVNEQHLRRAVWLFPALPAG